MSDFMSKTVKINMPLFMFICFALIMSWFMMRSIGFDSGYDKGVKAGLKEGREYVEMLVRNGYVKTNETIEISEPETDE